MRTFLCLAGCLLAVLAVPEPQRYPRPQYGKRVEYPEYPTEEYVYPANYEFKYGVEDSYTGQSFKHSEEKQGEKTSGSYQVALPDGRIQVVKYSADENGFVADVEYQGEAKYEKNYPAPAYPKQTYEKAYPKPAYPTEEPRYPARPSYQYEKEYQKPSYPSRYPSYPQEPSYPKYEPAYPKYEPVYPKYEPAYPTPATQRYQKPSAPEHYTLSPTPLYRPTPSKSWANSFSKEVKSEEPEIKSADATPAVVEEVATTTPAAVVATTVTATEAAAPESPATEAVPVSETEAPVDTTDAEQPQATTEEAVAPTDATEAPVKEAAPEEVATDAPVVTKIEEAAPATPTTTATPATTATPEEVKEEAKAPAEDAPKYPQRYRAPATYPRTPYATPSYPSYAPKPGYPQPHYSRPAYPAQPQKPYPSYLDRYRASPYYHKEAPAAGYRTPEAPVYVPRYL